MIAFPDGRVAVLDRSNHRVQLLDAAGKLAFVVRGRGARCGELASNGLFAFEDLVKRSRRTRPWELQWGYPDDLAGRGYELLVWLSGGVFVQGLRRLSVLHRSADGPDGSAPGRPGDPAGPSAAMGDFSAEAAAGHLGRPAAGGDGVVADVTGGDRTAALQCGRCAS